MADTQFKCSGDCLNCRLNPVERKTQWQYCAAQFTYNSMRMIERIQSSVESMSGTINELQAKIEAIQNVEADVFNPSEESSEPPIKSDGTSEIPTDHDIAQEGDGAEE